MENVKVNKSKINNPITCLLSPKQIDTEDINDILSSLDYIKEQ